MDPSEYLQPDFDPASYKVVQLRNVLLQNDVSYPTAAKKQDLIKLFNEKVKPTSDIKLKELNSVVANDSGIEIVEKKKKKKKSEEADPIVVEKIRKSKTKVEKEIHTRDRSPVRKSPRKPSRQEEDADTEKSIKRVPSKSIGEIPDLNNSGTYRDRSPSRKTSSSLDDTKTRLRSPSRRETSPIRKVKEQAKSKTKKKSILEPESLEPEEADIEILAQLDSKQTKLSKPSDDISFSSENVFQSPASSPQFNKTIPKKRTTEDHNKSPRKSTKRKTAFSSSPIADERPKSPIKRSLEIPKFEASSPVTTTKEQHDIFDFGDSSVKLEDAIDKSPVKTSPLKRSEIEEFKTPKENFKNNSSQNSTPSKDELRSKIPDFSKFKVSTAFANNFSLKNKETAKIEEDVTTVSNEDEIADVLDGPIDDGSFNDSELLDLQKDFDEAKTVILEEAEEAVKQINEIFHDHDPKRITQNFSFVPFFSFIKQLLVFTSIVAIVISGLWYREQRILVGYCGSEIDQPTFPNTSNEYLLQAEAFLETVKPKCLRCPKNAICLPNLQLKCKQDYIIHDPWYKLYGILPFESYCVKDQEKENIVNEILSKSLELLRTRNANTKCGDGDDLEVGISDDELYQFFFNSKTSAISDEDFNDLWARVLEDLKNEPEITLQYQRDNNSGHTSDDIPSDEDEEKKTNFRTKIVFRSNSTAKLSIGCKFQKEVYERFEANKKVIIGSVLLNLGLFFIYFKLKSYKKQQSKVNEISDIILTKLQKQSKSSNVDPTGLTNRYLSAIQLRDELLNNLNNSNKFKFWDLILNKLEKNSNIRSSTKEIHGEIVKVLEWIGE